jgi:hypothetical protein
MRYFALVLLSGINNTCGKFATGINSTGGKFATSKADRRQILPPISLVLLIPVANLPPVAMMPVANCHRYQGHQR